MADQSQVLDFLRSNFTRVYERLDRIETRLAEMTVRLSAVARDLAAMKVITPRPNCASTTWIAGSSASNDGWS